MRQIRTWNDIRTAVKNLIYNKRKLTNIGMQDTETGNKRKTK